MIIDAQDLIITEINYAALRDELQAAGLPVWISASMTRQPFDLRLEFPEGADRVVLLAILNAHDASQLSFDQQLDQHADLIEGQAEAEARTIPDFVGWTPAEAQAWVQNHVTDLATAKAALTKLAAMVAALNARVYPRIRAERQLSGE